MANADHDIGIGNRVRAARGRRGWSREALAVRAGISWSAITQLESGRRRNLRPSTLAGLAGALGVTVDYLVSGSAISSEMLEHGALVYHSDAEFALAAVRFLTEGVDHREAALAVTTSAHCDLLRERLDGAQPYVEFADRASWCDNPGRALTRLRTFVDRHIAAGAHWLRILVEPVTPDVSAADAWSWSRYESVLELVFRATPLTMLCAYDAGALDADGLEPAVIAHPHALGEAGGLVRNHGHLDPVDFVLGPPDQVPFPTAGQNR